MKKTVTCRKCGKKVTITVVPYGNGHIGLCPICGDLAYNGE